MIVYRCACGACYSLWREWFLHALTVNDERAHEVRRYETHTGSYLDKEGGVA